MKYSFFYLSFNKNNGLEQCGFCVVDIRIRGRRDHRTKWWGEA